MNPRDWVRGCGGPQTRCEGIVRNDVIGAFCIVISPLWLGSRQPQGAEHLFADTNSPTALSWAVFCYSKNWGDYMKRLFIATLLSFVCNWVFAETYNIDWFVDGASYSQTTCNAGDDIILPTAPTKRGYTFVGWRTHTLIEYLQSTGSQYINTGIVGKSGINVEMQFSFDATGTHYILASRTSTNRRFYVAAGYTTQWDITIGNDRIGGSFSTNTKYTVFFNSNSDGWNARVVDENETTIRSVNGTDTLNTSLNLLLFAANMAGSPQYYAKAKVYYVKIYDGDELVRDFIPVLDPNDVPCMYDRVTRRYFYNVRTGNFTPGPAI